MEGIVISTVFKPLDRIPEAASELMKGDKVQGLNPEHIQGQGDSVVAAGGEAPGKGAYGCWSQAMRGHLGRTGPTSDCA